MSTDSYTTVTAGPINTNATVDISTIVDVTSWRDVTADVRVAASATHLPVFGLPGYQFALLHVSAIVSLAISIIVSGAVTLYLTRTCTPIGRRTIGERLTIYLALCDLFYSLSHMLDHSYMMAVYGHPPDDICVVFSFFLFEFILAQSLLVSFTAVNAFLLVVKEIKVSLGRYDWRLLFGAFVLPATVAIPLAALKWIGPSGAWCFVDMRRATGPILTTILSCVLIGTFFANVVCYLLVWGKIQQVSRNTSAFGQSSQQASYHGTARILMLFVAAYIAQWWPYVTYSVWALFGNPPFLILYLVVLLCNMGGVFNFVAYTFVRVLLRRSTHSGKEDNSSGAAKTPSNPTSVAASTETIATVASM